MAAKKEKSPETDDPSTVISVDDREKIKELILKMETRVFDIEDLVPASYNPRVIDDEALNGLDESLSSLGYLQPIIVNVRDNKNVIVGGHQRYKVLLRKGVKQVECVIVDVDLETEKAMNISLNNPEISGRWDLNKLEPLLAELHADIPNFDQLQLSVLEASLDLNMEDFGNFDEEDEDKEEKEKS